MSKVPCEISLVWMLSLTMSKVSGLTSTFSRPARSFTRDSSLSARHVVIRYSMRRISSPAATNAARTAGSASSGVV